MIAVLVALIIASAAAPAIISRIGHRGFYLLACVPAASLVWVIANWPTAEAPLTARHPWVPALQMDIELRFTPLAAVLSVLILGVGALVLVYCASYFPSGKKRVPTFAAELVLFAGAMFGLVTSDNLLLTYVFWELTTVLSFLLVGFYAVRATSRRAATQALLVTTAGGLAMLVGIIMLGERAGTYTISEILADPPADGVYLQVTLVLLLIGALSKSAIVPLHFWLPGAMAAPTPVSAYLHAAAMVKAGIFLVALLAPTFAHGPAWHVPVVGLGLVSMVLAGWRSVREFDLKLILAFGTVSQLGLLLVLVGVGDANVALAGMTMLVAHALFKAALFMVVGVIDHATGTRDIRKLARLGHRLPVLAVIATVAGASMAGLPPLLGFVGKEAALASLSETGALPTWTDPIVLAAVVTGSMLTVCYTTRFLWGAFGRKLRRLPSRAVAELHQPSIAFMAPAGILAALSVVAGFAAAPIGTVLEAYARTLPPHGRELTHLALWHGLTPALGLSAIAITGGIGLFYLRKRLGAMLFLKPPLGNADRMYDAVLRAADALSLRMTRTTQRGSLPITQSVIIVTLVVLPTTALLLGNRDTPRLSGFDDAVQAVVAGFIIAGALATTVLRNRLAAVLLLGLTGYGNGIIFALYGAPDLALTQFLVETLTLVVFILVLRKLPAEIERRHETPLRPLRALIGIAFGALLVVVGMFAAAARTARPVSEDYPWAAYAIGHGKNAVNVLLIDIRAWDTMGEISVLVVAATGVASLVFRNRRFGAAPRISPEMREQADRDGAEPTWLAGSGWRDPRHRSLILEIATRLVFPTMMVLSVYFFFSGHNAPGGGFAGGLVAGMALVLRYLAGGRYELGEALPIDAGRILGLGLFFSGGTATASLLLGAPALSSATLSATLPVFGEVTLVTGIFFDFGVYLVVVGLVLDVLRSLGARLDADEQRRRRPQPPGSDPQGGLGARLDADEQRRTRRSQNEGAR